jgi:hypothetical protein
VLYRDQLAGEILRPGETVMDSLRGSFHGGLCRTSPFSSFVQVTEDFVANSCPFAVIRGPILVRWTSSVPLPNLPALEQTDV